MIIEYFIGNKEERETMEILNRYENSRHLEGTERRQFRNALILNNKFRRRREFVVSTSLAITALAGCLTSDYKSPKIVRS